MKLPNGQEVGLSPHCIPKPGAIMDWCPYGHFWYLAPDLEVSQPLFAVGQEIAMKPVHARVPKDIEEIRKFIAVVEVPPGGSDLHWPGQWLASFTPPEHWTAADRAAWNGFLAEPRVPAYLQEVLALCQALGEQAREIHWRWKGQLAAAFENRVLSRMSMPVEELLAATTAARSDPASSS